MKVIISVAYYMTILGLALILTIFEARAEEAELGLLTEWRQQIESSSCTEIRAEKGIDLRALGRKFPLIKEFQYFADSRRTPSFRIQVIGLSNSNSYFAESNVFISNVYFLTDDVEVSKTMAGFQNAYSFLWNDINIYIQATKRAKDKTVFYSAALVKSDSNGLLLLNSNNSDFIASMIFCSEPL